MNLPVRFVEIVRNVEEAIVCFQVPDSFLLAGLKKTEL